MCCPLTLATLIWLCSALLPINAGAWSPAWSPEGTLASEPAIHETNNRLLNHASLPPFVIAPIPDQNVTTVSEPLVFPLYSVFSSDENSILSFRVVVNNDNVAEGEIENDVLIISPGRPGSTRIRVFAEDPEGRQANDVFRINVRENNPPQVTQDVPVRDQTIIEGDTPFTLNLDSLFDDPDGDPLTFMVTSSEEGISEPRIERDLLVAPGNAPGKTVIEITATDPFGSANAVEFELEVVRAYPQQIQIGFRALIWSNFFDVELQAYRTPR